MTPLTGSPTKGSTSAYCAKEGEEAGKYPYQPVIGLMKRELYDLKKKILANEAQSLKPIDAKNHVTPRDN